MADMSRPDAIKRMMEAFEDLVVQREGEAFREERKHKPKPADPPLNNLGSPVEKQQRREAEELFDKSQFLESLTLFSALTSDTWLQFNCGVLRDLLHDNDGAIEEYELAIIRDDHNALAQYQLGVARFHKQQFERSLYHFIKAETGIRRVKESTTQFIEYRELGLNYRLWFSDVLFNKGVCHIFLQYGPFGKTTWELAKLSATSGSQQLAVIEEALRDISVLRFPLSFVNENEVPDLFRMRLKDKAIAKRNYLGNPKLVRSKPGSDGHQRSRSQQESIRIDATQSLSNGRIDDSPQSKTSSHGLHSTGASPSSASSLQSFKTSQWSANLPSRSPIDAMQSIDKQITKTALAEGVVQRPVMGARSLSATRENKPGKLDLGNAAFETNVPKENLRRAPRRTESEPPVDRYSAREATRRIARNVPAGTDNHALRAVEEDEVSELLETSTYHYKTHPTHNRPAQARSQSLSRIPAYPPRGSSAKSSGMEPHHRTLEEVLEDDKPFRPAASTVGSHSSQQLGHAGGSITASRLELLPEREITDLRIKVFYKDAMETLILRPAIGLVEFIDKAKKVFNIQSDISVRRKVESNYIALNTRAEWDILVAGYRRSAKQKGETIAKMRIWIEER